MVRASLRGSTEGRRLSRRGRWHALAPLAPVALLCVPACGSDDGPSQRVQTDLQLWQTVEDLRIGAVDDDHYAFNRIRDVAERPDGSIYVLDGAEGTITLYGPDGRFKARFAGRGGGPGEFSRPGPMDLLGDTIRVLDTGANRVTLFDLSGAVIGTIPLRLGFDERGFRLMPAFLFLDGTVVASSLVPSDVVADGLVQAVPMIRARSTGEVLDTIAHIPLANRTLAIRSPDETRPGGMFTQQPLADFPLFGLSLYDSTVVIVDRRATNVDHFGVVKLTPRGDTLYASRIPYAPSPITEEFEADIVSRWTESAASSPALSHLAPGALRRIVREALYLPPVQPPVSAFLVARDAGVWLRREARGRDTVEWLILDPALEPIGRTRLPARITIREATTRHVWAVDRDSNDVQSLIRLRIVRD